MNNSSPDRYSRQGFDSLSSAQTEEKTATIKALDEKRDATINDLDSKHTRENEEFIGNTKEIALLEDVLKNATEDEHRNLLNTERKSGGVSGIYAGMLGGHNVEISIGVSNTEIKIDGVRIYESHDNPNVRRGDWANRTIENKVPVDKDLVLKFLSGFHETHLKLFMEKVENAKS